MAWRLLTTTQNSNAAGAFTCANVPTIHASTNVTLANGLLSATYTAPNLVNAVQGIAIYVTAIGSAGTVQFNFQEATVTKVSTAAVNVTSLIVNQWNYIPVTAPFTYTSTAANNCRWTTTTAGLVGTTTFAQAATANFAFMGWDDLNSGSAPGATDEVWGIRPLGTAAITLTVTGTAQTIGSGLAPATINTSREVNMALYCGDGVKLKWDTTASATLTVKGAMKMDAGSEEQRGTVATPYPNGFNAILAFNENGAGNNSGCMFVNGAKCTRQGAPKSSTTLWKTTYSSGTGIAADPLITADAVNWDVGDEIFVAPTSNNAANYSEGEYRFIITKNSSTSYVLSTTSGGAESALVNSHTGGVILNLQRNVITRPTVSTLSHYQWFQSTTVDEINIDWARDESSGLFFNNKDGIRLTTASGHYASLDYSVHYNCLYNGWYFGGSTTTQTHNGLIIAKAAQGTAFGLNGGLNLAGATNRTFNDLYVVGASTLGLTVSGSSHTFNRGASIANNTSGTATVAGGIYVAGGNNTFNNMEFHCNRLGAAYLAGDVNSSWNNCVFGSKGNNAADIYPATTTLNLSNFNTCTFSSPTTATNYLNQVASSRISLQSYNSITTNHIVYTAYGTTRSTGAGLTDTTVRTAGTLNARIAPEEATTGQTMQFLIPAKVGNAVSVLMFIKANAAFTGDAAASASVNLYMPGSTTPDATATVSKADNNYNVVALAYNFAGSSDGFATVTINAKTTTAGAYIYVADIFNGTNTITAMKPWYNGQPAAIMFEQLGDASAVWQVLTSTLTTTGTTGKQLTKLLTTGKFIGLK